MIKNQHTANLVLIIVALLWGATFQITKVMGDFFGPFSFLALRYLLASILVMAVFHKHIADISGKVVLKSLFLAAIMAAGMGFQYLGIKHIEASKSAFITAMSVVMVPLFVFLIYRKKQSASSVAGALLAYIGLFIMSEINFQTGIGIGEIYTFICALCWTFYIIYANRFAKEEDPLKLSILQIIFTCLFFVFMWVLFDTRPTKFTVYSTIGVFVMGFLCTGAAYTLYTLAQRKTTAADSALILTLEPVFATVFALIIPDITGAREILTVRTLVGGSIIFLATITTELNLLAHLPNRKKI